ncbi:MAG: hypothetical protein ABH858_00565 [Candidatus Omnitrophota bacterium]
MKKKVKCPVCKTSLEVKGYHEADDNLVCDECDTSLKIISLDPIEVEVDEVKGFDDESGDDDDYGSFDDDGEADDDQ